MIFRAVITIILAYSTITLAQARKPAVEDFVGIEVEESKVAPQGTESLYNLEQDLNQIETSKNKPQLKPQKKTQESNSWSGMTLFGITVFLGLPLVVWYLVMSHFKKKASIENASNIAVLEKYRQEREKKSEENIKKAS